MAGTYILWGAPLSVYTAKARSYLIKKGIPFRELFPSHPDFGARILPALGFFAIPVLETPEGEIVQDTSDIIELLEARFPDPVVTPEDPALAALAALLGAYGSEGLNQPSMHYRWSFMDENGDFVRAEFGRAACSEPDRAARVEAAAPSIAFMSGYLPAIGIYPETIPAIEQSYLALLDNLDEHFLRHPYLLGGRPSVADFGFMVGLYAHLARDPSPSSLMKLRAPNVYRWTERMNTPGFFDGEFWNYGEAYVAAPTLVPLLSHIFADWGCELVAAAAAYNSWIMANPEMPTGTPPTLMPEAKVHPSLGTITYRFRNVEMRRDCAPQSLWHFDKAAAQIRALTGKDKSFLSAIVAQAGGTEAMAIDLARPMRRENNMLVLL